MKFWDWLMQDGEGVRSKKEEAEAEAPKSPAKRSAVDEIFAAATEPPPVKTELKTENRWHKVRLSLSNVAYSDFILTVIAVTLCAITFKIYTAPTPPTWGDFLALRDIPSERRKEAHKKLLENIPLVRVKGGEIEAEITNSSIEVTGDVSIVR